MNLNLFSVHAPKTEWLQLFFSMKDDFFSNHFLGPTQFNCFRRFLRDAALIESNRLTDFAEFISGLGWDSVESLGLMLINLVYTNPQIHWYIENLVIDQIYESTEIENKLRLFDVGVRDIHSIMDSYKRIVETPFGTHLRFGYVVTEYPRHIKYVRTKCLIRDARVILYGLYKYVESYGNGDYRAYPISTLIDNPVEQNKTSPCQIFGLSSEELYRRTLGLSINYPEYVNVQTENDSVVILSNEKTSKDVLTLF